MKGLLIAGTGSGVGKTSITLGIVRALVNRGIAVQCCKVGPDFLDPTWMSIASGRPCYNLDPWMSSPEYVSSLLSRLSSRADVVIVEGVMGMFDGASATSLEGSSAHVAQICTLPVFLVCNTHGVARSIAPMVAGFDRFEEGVSLGGVIANHCGSEHHVSILKDALEAAKLPPLVGAVQRDTLPSLPSRHLGLHTASAQQDAEHIIKGLADSVSKSMDLDLLLECAAPIVPAPHDRPQTSEKPVRIGYAWDNAFHFYYPDNREILESYGAEMIPFSPLVDSRIPEDCTGIYIGGGYPELYASDLAANTSMKQSIKEHANKGFPIYAECGGLMYLSQGVYDKENIYHEMLGLIPFSTRMLDRLKRLGYVSTTTTAQTVLGAAETELRGHEFHYSEIVGSYAGEHLYSLHGRRSPQPRSEGYGGGAILASYVHQHFGSNPNAARSFVEACRV